MKTIELSGIINIQSMDQFSRIRLIQPDFLQIDLISRFQEISDSFPNLEVQVLYCLSKDKKTKQELIKGYLNKIYQTASRKAFNSLVKNYIYFDDTGRLYLDQTVKVGTLNLKNSKGDYNYYITSERRINDYKGLGALLFAAIELE